MIAAGIESAHVEVPMIVGHSSRSVSIKFALTFEQTDARALVRGIPGSSRDRVYQSVLGNFFVKPDHAVGVFRLVKSRSHSRSVCHWLSQLLDLSGGHEQMFVFKDL